MNKKVLGKFGAQAVGLGLAAVMLTGCGLTKGLFGGANGQGASNGANAADNGAATANADAASNAASNASGANTSSNSSNASGTNPSTTPSGTTAATAPGTTSTSPKFAVKGAKYEYDTDHKVFLQYDPAGDWERHHVFCTDTTGKVTASYSTEQIAAILEQNDCFYQPLTLLFEKDGILYCKCSEIRDFGYGADAVFAIEPARNRVKKLFKLPEDGNVDTFDYYNGYFYSAVYTYGGHNSTANTVYKITKAQNDFSYDVTTDNSLNTFYATLKSLESSSSPYISKVSRTENDMECYERILGENGFVIRRTEDAYYTVDATGKKSKIEPGIDQPSFIVAFDSQFIFFATKEGETLGELYCYEDAMSKTTRLNVATTGLQYGIVYRDGALYYKTIDSQNSANSTVTLHCYDLKTGTDKELLSRQSKADDYMPFDDYLVEDGALFWEEDKYNQPTWYYAKLDDADGTVSALNLEKELVTLEKKEDRIARYGKVTQVKDAGNCPYCGEVLDEVEADVFALDASYSQQAAKINNTLKGLADKRLAYVHNRKIDFTADSCGNHSLNFMQTFNRYTVEDVNIVDGRYLTVSENESFTQTEGPADLYKRQYIFDLQTGEELNIMNFYTGTEAELKALLATKVKEDFEKACAEDSEPFDSKAANETYKSAVEHADLEAIYLEEDGIKCYFHSYDFCYGPYDSDFFAVRVSEKELLGK